MKSIYASTKPASHARFLAVLSTAGTLCLAHPVFCAPEATTSAQKDEVVIHVPYINAAGVRVVPPLNPDSANATLGTSVSHVDEDPLIVAPTGDYRGILAYTFPVYSPPLLSNFIVIYDTRSNTKTIYPVAVKANRVLQPQLSPDGSALVVMVGTYQGNWPRFRIYILNLRTHEWKIIPSAEVNYPHVVWSPDSRSIAFVEGGNIYGEEFPYGAGDPIRLIQCQWQEGKTRVVVQNKGVVGGFCFASPDTLLYSAVPQAQTGKGVQPGIYKIGKDGKPQLVIRYGHRPSVSPDGKRIAFYGADNVQHPSELAKEWWNDPQGSSLCVANFDGSERQTLNLQRNIFSPLFWPKAQDRLLSLDREQPSPHALFVLKQWDLQDGHWKGLGELHLEDSEDPGGDPEIDPQLRLCGPVEEDGSFFFYRGQIGGKITPNENLILRSIYRFEGATGKTVMVAQVRDKVGNIEGVGIDWHPFHS